jgi:drug/metabolite transporter (DMT)-like permease
VNSDSASTRRALGLAHLSGFLVGFPGLFGRWLDLNPGLITLGRTAIGAAALGVFARAAGVSLKIQTRRELAGLVIAGAALTANWLAFFQAVQVANVAVAVLAFSSFPLFVTLLEPLFFREKLHGRDVLTALAVIGGLACIAPLQELHNRLTQGVLWGVLCALSCAVLALISRVSVRSLPPVAVTFYQQAFGALFALPSLATLRQPVPLRSTLLLLLLGVVFTALPQAAMVASLRHLRAQVTSVIVALEPVYGILLAYFLLGEVPAARTLAGGAIILGAVVWTTRQQAADAARKK